MSSTPSPVAPSSDDDDTSCDLTPFFMSNYPGLAGVALLVFSYVPIRKRILSLSLVSTHFLWLVQNSESFCEDGPEEIDVSVLWTPGPSGEYTSDPMDERSRIPRIHHPAYGNPGYALSVKHNIPGGILRRILERYSKLIVELRVTGRINWSDCLILGVTTPKSRIRKLVLGSSEPRHRARARPSSDDSEDEGEEDDSQAITLAFPQFKNYICGFPNLREIVLLESVSLVTGLGLEIEATAETSISLVERVRVFSTTQFRFETLMRDCRKHCPRLQMVSVSRDLYTKMQSQIVRCLQTTIRDDLRTLQKLGTWTRPLCFVFPAHSAYEEVFFGDCGYVWRFGSVGDRKIEIQGISPGDARFAYSFRFEDGGCCVRGSNRYHLLGATPLRASSRSGSSSMKCTVQIRREGLMQIEESAARSRKFLHSARGLRTPSVGSVDLCLHEYQASVYSASDKGSSIQQSLSATLLGLMLSEGEWRESENFSWNGEFLLFSIPWTYKMTYCPEFDLLQFRLVSLLPGPRLVLKTRIILSVGDFVSSSGTTDFGAALSCSLCVDGFTWDRKTPIRANLLVEIVDVLSVREYEQGKQARTQEWEARWHGSMAVQRLETVDFELPNVPEGTFETEKQLNVCGLQWKFQMQSSACHFGRSQLSVISQVDETRVVEARLAVVSEGGLYLEVPPTLFRGEHRHELKHITLPHVPLSRARKFRLGLVIFRGKSFDVVKAEEEERVQAMTALIEKSPHSTGGHGRYRVGKFIIEKMLGQVSIREEDPLNPVYRHFKLFEGKFPVVFTFYPNGTVDPDFTSFELRPAFVSRVAIKGEFHVSLYCEHEEEKHQFSVTVKQNPGSSAFVCSRFAPKHARRDWVFTIVAIFRAVRLRGQERQ